MAFLDSVKIGLTTAVDTVSGITQTLVEKNRVNAQLNRLRTIMRNECEMINRAYITLGKKYYENKMNNKTEACDNEEELFKIIENSKEQIRKARERYRKIVEMQTVESESKYSVEDLEDITVACSNEDEYEEIPFKAEEKSEEIPQEETTADAEVADEDTF